MKDTVKSTLLKFAMCPGNCTTEAPCATCTYAGKPNCESLLRHESIQLLQAGETVQEAPKVPPRLKDAITTMLHDLGVPSHIKGFKYLREAIAIQVRDTRSIEAITKVLYPQVAKTFQTTSNRAERAMRHAIEVAWDRGNLHVLERLFGYTVDPKKGKPTNGEFIALVADKLILDFEGGNLKIDF